MSYISKTIWCMSAIFSVNETAWLKFWPQSKYKSTWPIFHGLVILLNIFKIIWYMLIFVFTDTVSPLRYLKSSCVTWLSKTYMLIILIVWHSLSPPLPTIPLRHLVTQNIDANILIVWHCLSLPLPKVPLRYLVTQNIYANIIIAWYCLSPPLPKVPLCYLVTRNIHAYICLYWHSLSAPLPKVPLRYLLPKT